MLQIKRVLKVLLFIVIIALFLHKLYFWVYYVEETPERSIFAPQTVNGLIIAIAYQLWDYSQYDAYGLTQQGIVVIWSAAVKNPHFGNLSLLSDSAFFTIKRLMFELAQLFLTLLTSVKFWKEACITAREHFLLSSNRTLIANLDSSTSEIVSGLLFGNRLSSHSELRHLLEVTGTSHLAVVSGFHLNLFLSMLGQTYRNWLPKWAVGGLDILSAVFYLFLIGFSHSLGRAVAMTSLRSFASQFCKRRYLPLVALFWAAVVLLLVDRESLESISFQLSFVATFGIVIFSSYINQNSGLFLAEASSITATESVSKTSSQHGFLSHSFLQIHGYFKDSMSVGLAAWLFTTPLVLYHFGTVSLLGAVATAVVGWLLPPLILTGYGALLTSLVFPIDGLLSSLFFLPVRFCAEFFIFILEIVASLEWVFVYRVETVADLFFWYGVLFCVILLLWGARSARANAIYVQNTSITL